MHGMKREVEMQRETWGRKPQRDVLVLHLDT